MLNSHPTPRDSVTHSLEGSCSHWPAAWTLERSWFSSLEGTEFDIPCLANTLMGGDVYSGCFFHQVVERLDFSPVPVARCSLVHLLNLDGPWGGFRRKLLPVKPGHTSQLPGFPSPG